MLSSSHFIRTATGLRFDYLDPRPEQVEIEDIAHALACIPRFVGHTPLPVSVAEHSVRVSELLPAELATAGLLHDATEAYVLDLPSPLKALLPSYRDIEDRVWRAIAARFGLPESLPPAIKQADRLILATEVDRYFPAMRADFGNSLPAPLNVRWEEPWSREQAKREFLSAFGSTLPIEKQQSWQPAA